MAKISMLKDLTYASSGMTSNLSQPTGETLTSIPDFGHDEGLLPVVAQDVNTGEVLMLANMNQAAWEQTLSDGEAVYYSRSRKRLWKKGEKQ